MVIRHLKDNLPSREMELVLRKVPQALSLYQVGFCGPIGHEIRNLRGKFEAFEKNLKTKAHENFKIYIFPKSNQSLYKLFTSKSMNDHRIHRKKFIRGL